MLRRASCLVRTSTTPPLPLRTNNKLQACLLVTVLGLLSACSEKSNPCIDTTSCDPAAESVNTGQTTNTVDELPLAMIDDLHYAGAFRMSTGVHGDSELSYSLGVIEVVDNSLFIVGHAQRPGIAEFRIPSLSMSTDVAELNSAGAPTQDFHLVLDKVSDGNPQNIDYITGIEAYDGKLIVNGVEYYDAATDNTASTLLISDASNISQSSITGFYNLPGAARAAGWMTQLSPYWQNKLGKTHIAGNATGTTAIISRHSVGPSAHAINAADILTAAVNTELETDQLMEFSLDTAMHTDLYNSDGTNDLWNFLSQAVYGFVIPGTRTYATFGSSGGNESGIGYKNTQDDGNVCGGYCSNNVADNYNYYWLWDMDKLLDVQQGLSDPHDMRPYAYGKFDVPFQSQGFNRIGGASFDNESQRLYISITRADRLASEYTFAPIIIAYEISPIAGPARR